MIPIDNGSMDRKGNDGKRKKTKRKCGELGGMFGCIFFKGTVGSVSIGCLNCMPSHYV